MDIELVRAAVYTLQAKGQLVSQRAVVRMTGGSRRDIARHMKTLAAAEGADPEPLAEPEREPDAMQVAQDRLTRAEAEVARVRAASDAAYTEVVQSLLVVMALDYAAQARLTAPIQMDHRNEEARVRYSRAAARYNDLYLRSGPRVVAAVQEARAAVEAVRTQVREAEQRQWVQAHQPELLAAVKKVERDFAGTNNPIGRREAERAALRALKGAMDAAPLAVAS